MLAELYDAEQARVGYLPNFTKAFAHRPAVYQAWQQLNAAIKESAGERRYELVTLAAARRLRSSYCMLAHGKVLAERFLEPELVRSIADETGPTGLDPAEAAAMDFAEKVVADATSITASDLDRLRGLGLTDPEILDVALTAAARCFFSKVLDAVGAQPDPAFAELDPGLRDALTVGRPIAEQQGTRIGGGRRVRKGGAPWLS